MPPTVTSSMTSRAGAPSSSSGDLGAHQVADRARAEGAQVGGEAIDRMAAQVQPERFLLVAEPLHLGPRRHRRQDVRGRAGGLVAAAAEQVGLPLFAVALDARAVLGGLVDGPRTAARGPWPAAPVCR